MAIYINNRRVYRHIIRLRTKVRRLSIGSWQVAGISVSTVYIDNVPHAQSWDFTRKIRSSIQLAVPEDTSNDKTDQ
jgi:hypothetical protein